MISNRMTMGAAMLLAIVAGAAHAETTGRTLISRADGWTVRPAADLSTATFAPADIKAGEAAAKMAGFAKTALDHHFASETVGSVGYLCGRQPHTREDNGPASASGPEGTFLGAKLSLAFR